MACTQQKIVVKYLSTHETHTAYQTVSYIVSCKFIMKLLKLVERHSLQLFLLSAHGEDGLRKGKKKSELEKSFC